MMHKEKVGLLNLVKSKNFCSTKDSVKRVESQLHIGAHYKKKALYLRYIRISQNLATFTQTFKKMGKRFEQTSP